MANAYSERWVRTARRECLNHLLIFGRQHLEKVMVEFIDHYNQARPHQGIEQRRPCEAANVIRLPTGCAVSPWSVGSELRVPSTLV